MKLSKNNNTSFPVLLCGKGDHDMLTIGVESRDTGGRADVHAIMTPS